MPEQSNGSSNSPSPTPTTGSSGGSEMGVDSLSDVTADFLSDKSLGTPVNAPAAPNAEPSEPSHEPMFQPELLVEDQSAPTAPPTPQPSTTQPATPAEPSRPASRDLSWAPPETHRALRAMSNEAFDLLAPVFQKHLESEANPAPKVPNYFEHERGYELDPEYAEFQQQAHQLEMEYNFWRAQKSRALKGEQVQGLEQDPKTGKIYVTQPEDPTAELMVEIDSKLAEARQYQLQATTELDKFKNSFKEQHQTFHSNLKKVYETDFKPLEKALGPKLDAFLDARFPKSLHNQPQFRSIAVLGLSLQIAMQKLAAFQQRNGLQHSVSAPVPPTANGSNSPGNPKRVTEADEKFFEQFMG